MKQFMFFMFIAGVTALTDTEQWTKFKSRHGKAYTSAVEDRKRYSIFKQNLQKIQDHNAKYERKEVSYAMKVTQFTDMTLDEFKHFLSKSFGDIPKITADSQIASKSDHDDIEEDTAELPTAVNWKQEGAVTKVKNQGLCSCWAFSAVGALEAQLYQKNGTLEDLSAQDLVDCADATYGNTGCAGGLMTNAFDYVKDKGILSESEYPYKGISDFCRQKHEGFKIQRYVNLAMSDEKALAQAVAQVGPVSCAMDATFIQSYSHGIIDNSSGCESERLLLNHGVLVVGYGQEEGIEYWLILALVAALVLAVNGLSDQEEWKQFKIQHAKTYRSLLEEKRRFEIFKSNCRTIEEHNKRYYNGEETFEMKINQFGDMTQEEFRQMLTLQKVQMPPRSGDLMSFDDIQDLPKTVDWREKGAVTKVQNQGSCGSCWAFSAVGAIEGQVFIKNGTLEPLSAQNLVDCAGEEYGNEGCSGGWMDSAFKYAQQHGVLPEKEYPYWGHTGKCQKQGGVKVSGYIDVPKGDEKALAKAVATIGPVSVAVDASHFMFYFGGVISQSCGCRSSDGFLNHGVLLVGYGEDYWIVKNSWAGWWGERGYFRLKKDDGNTCGEMKILALVAALVLAINGLSDQEEWKQFKIQHGKTYRSLLEEKRRFAIFKSNCRTIEEHNKRYYNGEETFEMKINQFGDMTQEEFRQMLTLQKVQMPPRSGDLMSLDDIQDLPKTVDWREKGAVTKVQDQGSCSSCWAFSAVFIKNGTLEPLSAQNLVDCAGEEYGNEGCRGGWMESAFKYAQQHGVLPEKEYPYWGFDGKCRKQGGVKLSGYIDVPKGDEKALAKAVATIGPVSVAVDASHFMFYFGGVISQSCGCKSADVFLNHGVLLVGYGEDYWILKNSWAGWWGERGYFRLKKDDGNTCGIATAATYPTLSLLEEKRRFGIFKSNCRKIEKHKKRYDNGEETFEMKINQFGSITQEEIR
nr:unnamed protein product [Callosobruchus chinensis]